MHGELGVTKDVGKVAGGHYLGFDEGDGLVWVADGLSQHLYSMNLFYSFAAVCGDYIVQFLFQGGRQVGEDGRTLDGSKDPIFSLVQDAAKPWAFSSDEVKGLFDIGVQNTKWKVIHVSI